MDTERDTKFILASSSPRRKELLERIGARFEIIPADVEEDLEGHDDPEAMVRFNAELKASWVAVQWPHRFVLGSDTTVHIDGRVLNKPKDMDEARQMLKTLSGRTHFVYTGYSLQCVEKELVVTEGVRSEVSFKTLDDDAITRYFAVVNPLDKAGSYGIQQGTEIIIASFEGSHSNIMGLPIEETKETLARFGLI